jgi:acyl carrier protein
LTQFGKKLRLPDQFGNKDGYRQQKALINTGLKNMDDTIIDKLSHYIASQILKQPNRQISSTEPLISSGLIDSFSLVDLALYVEDTYGVRIDDTELNADTFDTLEQLATIIQDRSE